MPQVRTLEDFSPPRRYDTLPFTSALIQESATQTGTFTTIDTQALSPVDTDPADPASRDFTTDDATLDAGWYRVRWRDAALATFDSDAVYFPQSGATGDLTTLSSVRSYLQKDAPDTAQDPVIQTLITRASKAIHTFAQREFAPAQTATRLFHWHGGPLHLAPYDLRTVTSIRLNTDSSTITTLTSTGYRLRPKPARDGVYRWIDLVDYDLSPDRRLTSTDPIWEVEIAGGWGFATIPDDVAHWANVTVDTWLRREVQAFGSTFGAPDAEQLERPESLPLDVRKGLGHYRIVGAG